MWRRWHFDWMPKWCLIPNLARNFEFCPWPSYKLIQASRKWKSPLCDTAKASWGYSLYVNQSKPTDTKTFKSSNVGNQRQKSYPVHFSSSQMCNFFFKNKLNWPLASQFRYTTLTLKSMKPWSSLIFYSLFHARRRINYGLISLPRSYFSILFFI